MRTLLSTLKFEAQKGIKAEMITKRTRAGTHFKK